MAIISIQALHRRLYQATSERLTVS
jgi:hypothetical protein